MFQMGSFLPGSMKLQRILVIHNVLSEGTVVPDTIPEIRKCDVFCRNEYIILLWLYAQSGLTPDFLVRVLTMKKRCAPLDINLLHKPQCFEFIPQMRLKDTLKMFHSTAIADGHQPSPIHPPEDRYLWYPALRRIW